MKRIVFILVFICFTNVLMANDEIKEYPVFSLTKYEKERVKVWKYFHHRKVTKRDKAYLSLYDLNGDGINEVFAYIESFDYCGQSTGCYLFILEKEDKTLSILLENKFTLPTFFQMKIAKDGSQNYISVSKEKYKDWNKLLVSKNTTLVFNGKYYDNN